MTDDTQTPKPKKPKPTSGPGSARRTKGDKGGFAPLDVDRDACFDLYYAMGKGRSCRKLSDKIAEEFGKKVSPQTVSRWSIADGWQDRIAVRDVETGANIAEALKLLEERGQKIAPAHFKGLVGHCMETAKRCAYAIAINTPGELDTFVDVMIKIDRYAAEMSTGAIASLANGANNDGKVVLGKFQQAARANGFAANGNGHANGNGNAEK